ncbi:monofunctional biosynthetic peptidoglycan transglycosylase [Neopusillimonas maritima]|jgi:monofunctional biosynthetic peptidoglycan transglycosylase|uniref:Biosynthetic peptidoglycan transglycosylase n=1 Tax=Neopusillimonas maritima TaxID=2026239 RepID=A0ABX9MZR8_9BURK|nr:monofunctional biosynthetic peptidoglycan transglycosylase [Neopusillimonas maritima]RII84462.1 monofunctional biosynthetic peptidoglycan transglycosylase [Neopusillimonas maritima]
MSRSKSKLIGIVLLAGLFAFLLYQFGLFVMVIWLKFHNPSTSAFMRNTLTQLQAEQANAQIIHTWVPYDKISTNLKRAVVAAEDSNFINHSGVEWEAIQRAWEYNMRMSESGSERVRGGSTITQQLAKNLFLSSDRSYWRKAQELLLTFMLEAVLSKQRILELYLNIAQWGKNVFGAQAAAEHYFKRHASQLNAAQSARLAAMLPNPAYYDKRGNTRYLQSRTRTLLQRMRMVEVP